jgi:hypothetical protein
MFKILLEYSNNYHKLDLNVSILKFKDYFVIK